MKQLLLGLSVIVLLTACRTRTAYSTTGFEYLPQDVQRAVRNEIGNAKIVVAYPTTVAGVPGYYEIDYISQGVRKGLRVDQHATYVAASDSKYTLHEAAGAQRQH